MNNWKAQSVINLMGFAYFASLVGGRQKENHMEYEKKKWLQTVLRS